MRMGRFLTAIGSTAILLAFSLNTVLAANSTTDFSPSCLLSQGESKTVALNIRNNDAIEHDYTLSAGGTINHYELSFSSSTGQIATVKIPPGGTATFDLNISMNDPPSVNTDTLIITATDENGQENTIDLSIVVNTDYLLTLTSLSDRAEILNGKTTDLTFSVKNNGSQEVDAIKLQAELPNKWLISQGADATINLKPGETGTFKITVEVPTSQVAGNQNLSVSAVSSETQSNTFELPVTVRTSSNIAYWMIGILVIVAGFTFIQFRKHGRR